MHEGNLPSQSEKLGLAWVREGDRSKSQEREDGTELHGAQMSPEVGRRHALGSELLPLQASVSPSTQQWGAEEAYPDDLQGPFCSTVLGFQENPAPLLSTPAASLL